MNALFNNSILYFSSYKSIIIHKDFIYSAASFNGNSILLAVFKAGTAQPTFRRYGWKKVNQFGLWENTKVKKE
jgi:hypothetical protein